MLHQATEELELGCTLRTMVHILFVSRALQVLVQTLERPELLGTEIALVEMAVPGGFCGPGVDSS